MCVLWCAVLYPCLRTCPQSNESLARSFAARLSPYLLAPARPSSSPPSSATAACRFVSHCGLLQQRNSYDCGVFALAAADAVSQWVEQGEQGDVQQAVAAHCTQQAITAYRQRVTAAVQHMVKAAGAQQQQRGKVRVSTTSRRPPPTLSRHSSAH